MELVFTKWACAFLLCCWLFTSGVYSVSNLFLSFKWRGCVGIPKLEGNLGGWLVIEGWIKPSLFDGIANGDMIDGTQVQLKSVTLQKDVSAENTLWRLSEFEFQFRTPQGQFLTCNGDGCSLSATAKSASTSESFSLERKEDNRIHIKTKNGAHLQATTGGQITADYPGVPGWDDNGSTFEMTIVANTIRGDYQLTNGYGHDRAKEVLKRHRNSFITVEDFNFLYRHGINTVRIPVGWRIAFDPDPPAPFVGGSLEALDNAFSWAQEYDIKYIIDLHASPVSQNGMEHSASRDGFTGWPTDPDYIAQTLHVIDFLVSREAQLQALNNGSGPLLFVWELVDEWNLTNGPQTDYQNFGRSQLEAYNAASFGWTYWTLKNDRKHWDFEWSVKNKYLQFLVRNEIRKISEKQIKEEDHLKQRVLYPVKTP